MYRRQHHLPQTPALGWYVECIEEILTRLQSQTSARIAVLDISMIGEDLASDMNCRVDSYSRAMTHLALISAALNLDRDLGA